ncbi:MAG: sterol desaturase family protein [Terrimonas sp.]|nr:sterol desaturase family protein [Terrimonas sp.]
MQPDSTLMMHAIPGFLAFIIAEVIYNRKELLSPESKQELLASFGIAAGASVISILTKGIIILFYSLLYQYRFFNLPNHQVWVWVICFLGDDLSWYWFHRTSHQVRFFWASHAVHHSPEVFSLSGGMRVPLTSNLTGNFLFWAWMPLVGIEPGMIILMKAISVIYQFWLHTEVIKKMPGWFEFIFNTPSHHRVHHGTNVEYLDKNHGGFLIIWDRLFGSFQEEKWKPVYGLTKKIASHNPVRIAFHEWKNMFVDYGRARTFNDYLNYTFNSPGWSHDGRSKTTKQLRNALKRKSDSCDLPVKWGKTHLPENKFTVVLPDNKTSGSLL